MKACIFDLDGTLLDSMRLWEQIDRDFLTQRGLEVPPDYVEAVTSLSFPEAAAYTIRRFRLPDSADSLMREWNDRAVYAYGHTISMKPYAKEYLLRLKERGVKLGIATSLSGALYRPALAQHGIGHFFDVICSTDEVSCSKAHPDVFLLTAERLDVSPRDCVLFEDILAAVQSGKTAGMTVYAVYDDASKDSWDAIKQIADGTLCDFSTAPLPETGGARNVVFKKFKG